MRAEQLLAGVGLLLGMFPHTATSQSIRIEDVPTEMVEEYGECAVYYNIDKLCLEQSDFAGNTAVAEAASTSLKYIYTAASAAGMSGDGLAAKYRLTFNTEMTLISKACINIDVLIERYASRCKSLLENPTDRMAKLMSGENDWPPLP
jgi:hypothetical protein